jgi:hypothetical protein
MKLDFEKYSIKYTDKKLFEKLKKFAVKSRLESWFGKVNESELAEVNAKL